MLTTELNSRYNGLFHLEGPAHIRRDRGPNMAKTNSLSAECWLGLLAVLTDSCSVTCLGAGTIVGRKDGHW